MPTATPDAVGAFFLDILEPVDGIEVVSVDIFEVIRRTSVDALVAVQRHVRSMPALIVGQV